MGPEDGSRNGKRKVRELCRPDGARRSTAVSSEYGETQVSARRTSVTSLNVQGMGANLGPRAVEIKRTRPLERGERFLNRSVLTIQLFTSVVAIRLDLAITET